MCRFDPRALASRTIPRPFSPRPSLLLPISRSILRPLLIDSILISCLHHPSPIPTSFPLWPSQQRPPAPRLNIPLPPTTTTTTTTPNQPLQPRHPPRHPLPTITPPNPRPPRQPNPHHLQHPNTKHHSQLPAHRRPQPALPPRQARLRPAKLLRARPRLRRPAAMGKGPRHVLRRAEAAAVEGVLDAADGARVVGLVEGTPVG